MELIFGIALSLHVGLKEKYNEIHPFVSWQYRQLIAGAYYNSLEKTSLYLGYKLEMTEKIELDLGVVSGYREDPEKLLPMARLKYDNWFVMPAAEEDNAGVVIGYEFKF